MEADVIAPLRFEAMGCPCEILLDTPDPEVSAAQLTAARQEAERLEARYSRYRPGSVVEQLNSGRLKRTEVDPQTAALLAFADECCRLSDGLFDVRASSGGQKIDLGGIVKEYAADTILAFLRKRHPISTLVNLGGDIAAAGERKWSVGIEDVTRPGCSQQTIYLCQGGIATSGTTHRGGHILNPKTGEPVREAPLSITVAAKTCTEAGFWSTLAMLQGAKAEAFLAAQRLEFWCTRA